MKTLSNAACLSEILDRLSHVRADSPRQWGKMNAHQMVCHLADSLRGMMGRKQVSPADRPFRPVMKWAALNLPMKWPQGVPTRPEVDQQKSGTEPAEFEADLRELISLHSGIRAIRAPFNFQSAPDLRPDDGERMDALVLSAPRPPPQAIRLLKFCTRRT